MQKKLTALFLAFLTCTALATTPNSINRFTDRSYTLSGLVDQIVLAGQEHVLNGRSNYNDTFTAFDDTVAKIASALPKTTKNNRNVKEQG